MPTDSVQDAIKELATFPHQPQAPWVAKVTAAPTEVIAGAILYWGPSGTGAYVAATDLNASLREAAMAILQQRFAAEQAHFAIEATRQSRRMLGLTWAIAVLTAVMLIAVGVQIILAFNPPVPPLSY
jgi:Tfp pilus tip-associated adhesin PilY1